MLAFLSIIEDEYFNYRFTYFRRYSSYRSPLTYCRILSKRPRGARLLIAIGVLRLVSLYRRYD